MRIPIWSELSESGKTLLVCLLSALVVLFVIIYSSRIPSHTQSSSRSEIRDGTIGTYVFRDPEYGCEYLTRSGPVGLVPRVRPQSSGQPVQVCGQPQNAPIQLQTFPLPMR